MTLLTIVGTALTIILLIVKAVLDKSAIKKKEKDDEDKKIDSASNATDLLREFDKLRNK